MNRIDMFISGIRVWDFAFGTGLGYAPINVRPAGGGGGGGRARGRDLTFKQNFVSNSLPQGFKCRSNRSYPGAIKTVSKRLWSILI